MRKVVMVVIVLCATNSFGQNRKIRKPRITGQSSHVLEDGLFIHRQPPIKMSDYSSIFVEIPKVREIKVHDLIKIVVSEKSQVQVTSQGNARRNSTFKAALKEFIRIGPRGRLSNAANNEPTIDATLTKQVQAQGRLKDKESLTFRITAMVVDVLPNGNLVLEAHKRNELSDDSWGFSLSGIVRAADIASDNTIQSEDMYNLNIRKIQGGKIYNTTRRPWGTKIFEFIWPFG